LDFSSYRHLPIRKDPSFETVRRHEWNPSSSSACFRAATSPSQVPLFRVRIRALRKHHPHSPDSAIALRISGYGRGARIGSRRARDHVLRPNRSAIDPAPDCACPCIPDDQHHDRRPRDVVLQHLHSGDRLLTLCSGQSLPRARLRILLFVPVNVLAYSQLRPDQNNRASSLTNLFRNWGGSFGIAFITTATERRHQFHQTNLGSDIGATSQQLGNRITALTNYLVTKGFSGPDAGYGCARISAPAVSGSSESFVLHGLLPCHRVADIGRSPSAVVCPAFQASRKGARISLRTMRYLAPAGH